MTAARIASQPTPEIEPMLPAKQTLGTAARRASIAAAALLIVGLSAAQAGTRNAHMSVTVQVVDQCTVSTAALLPGEGASVTCSSGARAAVSGGANGARSAYTVKRVEGALTTYGPVSTSVDKATGRQTQTQVVTITF